MNVLPCTWDFLLCYCGGKGGVQVYLCISTYVCMYLDEKSKGPVFLSAYMLVDSAYKEKQ